MELSPIPTARMMIGASAMRETQFSATTDFVAASRRSRPSGRVQDFALNLNLPRRKLRRFAAPVRLAAAGFSVLMFGDWRPTRLRPASSQDDTGSAAFDSHTLPAWEPVASHFEFWPGWAFYTPIVLHWIGLGLRYGALSLPTAANPRIATGGLCGESKTDILDQIGGSHARWVAPYTRLRPSGPLSCEQAMAERGLAYPIVAKPDIGCNGAGVRLVDGRPALDRYLSEFPRNASLILQHFVPFEGEAGLFYVRRPGAQNGRITSLTLKHSPVVVGDGLRSLRTLIKADRRAILARHCFEPNLAGRLDEVPGPDERVCLAFVGNHCKGSSFWDGRGQVTAALDARLDSIARAMPEFHFGRFDVRFRSLAALREGEFFIIEANGIGSEATHVWDPRTRLTDAWADQFWHYRMAFEIGRANRARGFRPSGVGEMFRFWRLQRRLMRSYPRNS